MSDADWLIVAMVIATCGIVFGGLMHRREPEWCDGCKRFSREQFCPYCDKEARER